MRMSSSRVAQIPEDYMYDKAGGFTVAAHTCSLCYDRHTNVFGRFSFRATMVLSFYLLINSMKIEAEEAQ